MNGKDYLVFSPLVRCAFVLEIPNSFPPCPAKSRLGGESGNSQPRPRIAVSDEAEGVCQPMLGKTRIGRTGH